MQAGTRSGNRAYPLYGIRMAVAPYRESSYLIWISRHRHLHWGQWGHWGHRINRGFPCPQSVPSALKKWGQIFFYAHFRAYLRKFQLFRPLFLHLSHLFCISFTAPDAHLREFNKRAALSYPGAGRSGFAARKKLPHPTAYRRPCHH